MDKLFYVIAICIVFFVSPYAGASGPIIEKFALSNEKAFEDYFIENQDKYVISSFEYADKFIIDFLNQYASDSTLEKGLAEAGKLSCYKVSGTHLTIKYPAEQSVDGYVFSFYKLPDTVTPTYLLHLGDLFEIDPEKDKYFGYGTLRIVLVDKSKHRHEIAARFEDTNFYDAIIKPQKSFDNTQKQYLAKKHKNPLDHFPCYNLEGNIMPFYDCYGGRFDLDGKVGDYFSVDASGKIKFTSGGIIPPNLVRIHKYKIEWVWDPKRKKLYATTLHWNIHEEPLPDGSDTRIVEKIIDLSQ